MADAPNYSELVASQRAYFNSGVTRELSWRKEQLLAIVRMIEENEEDFVAALTKDLHKHRNEATLMETAMIKNDAIEAVNHLDGWAAPQKVKKPLVNFADEAYIQPEPYGVTLLLGAWNYPIQLVFLPLIGCISAGNTCVIKPSEVAEQSAAIMERLVPKYLDTKAFTVINGGVPETTALLKERYDYIFYTGNTVVGKIIYEAAAKHLTPVTLELGGKSPVYIDDSSDMDIVAQRITWGRFANCGQTCVAPDYILCTKEIQDVLIEKMEKKIKKFYTDNPQQSDSYGRMINGRHVQRVKNLMSSGTTALGGQVDEKDNYIAPTVLKDCKPSDPAMKEEIFGPVLPIMTVRNEDEAIQHINSGEKPLALYVFSKRTDVVDKILKCTSAGGVCVNDTMMHIGLETLPFGGVGHSGIGAYHGKFSFDTYSHSKPVLKRKQGMEQGNELRYPPYTPKKLNTITWITKKSLKKNGIAGFLPVIAIGVVLAFILKFIGFEKYLPQSLK